MERDGVTEGETFYLDEFIGKEEQTRKWKRRKGKGLRHRGRNLIP